MCKPKAPKVAAIPPAPAPAEPSAGVAQADPITMNSSDTDVRRKGRNGLRIDRAMGGTGGGSGLNIPIG